MKQIYDWDKRKAQINLAKHKVSFEEGETIFDDPLLITYPDELHSEKEDRLILQRKVENGKYQNPVYRLSQTTF